MGSLPLATQHFSPDNSIRKFEWNTIIWVQAAVFHSIVYCVAPLYVLHFNELNYATEQLIFGYLLFVASFAEVQMLRRKPFLKPITRGRAPKNRLSLSLYFSRSSLFKRNVQTIAGKTYLPLLRNFNAIKSYFHCHKCIANETYQLFKSRRLPVIFTLPQAQALLHKANRVPDFQNGKKRQWTNVGILTFVHKNTYR